MLQVWNGPDPDFKKTEQSDESQLSEPSFPALAGTAQVSAVDCRSNIHLRLQGIQFWEWIHDSTDSTTSTRQILWNLSATAVYTRTPPSNLEADQQQRLDTRWRYRHKKTQKPHATSRDDKGTIYSGQVPGWSGSRNPRACHHQDFPPHKKNSQRESIHLSRISKALCGLGL